MSLSPIFWICAAVLESCREGEQSVIRSLFIAPKLAIRTRQSSVVLSNHTANGWSLLLIYGETFIGLSDDLINDVLDLVPNFPGGDLPIRARAFAHDAFDVRHLAFAPELDRFRSDEFQNLIDQTARCDFAAATEINQLSIEPVA